ncbi:MAG TPA: glycosyltransferase family 2 protein [Bacillota bacterium]|nr:glycosyltransferase family 2 protein [Bacillota bacterium]
MTEYQRLLISIIIPTVNQVELVRNCLASLAASQPSVLYPYEIIVVDDGSPPEIQQGLREVIKPYGARLVTLPNNSGFSTTVNRGVAQSKGGYICLLNNDVTLVQRNWLDLMMADALRSRVGVVGPRLLYLNGLIQHGGLIYLPQSGGFDHEYRSFPGDYPPATHSREVLGVTGALMLINRRLWDALGGMDERFFVGMEDIDFSLRTWEKGWRIYYTGGAFAIHPEGTTRGHDPYWRAKGAESGVRFQQKWQRKLYLLRNACRVNEGTRFGQAARSVSEEQAIRWRKLVTRGPNTNASFRPHDPNPTFRSHSH